MRPRDEPSRRHYRRSNAFPSSREECLAVRNAVGLMEISGFGKYESTGPGAAAWLNRVLAGKVPRRVAWRSRRCSTNAAASSATSRSPARRDERFLLIGSGAAEDYHMRWFERHRRPPARSIAPLGPTLSASRLRGRSRASCCSVSRADVSNEAFPFLPSARWTLAWSRAPSSRVATPAILATRSGSRPTTSARSTTLLASGRELGLGSSAAARCTRCGSRSPSAPGRANTARSTGPSRPGSAASSTSPRRISSARRRGGGAQGAGAARLRAFAVEADDADAIGDEPVSHDGKVSAG